MTPTEFLEAYPEAPLRTGNLHDIACPMCGQRDGFMIEAREMVTVTELREDAHGDREWDRDSYARCDACDISEDVRYFTIRGLDDLIEERLAAPTQPTAQFTTPPSSPESHFL
jgi:hypothetical protein